MKGIVHTVWHYIAKNPVIFNNPLCIFQVERYISQQFTTRLFPPPPKKNTLQFFF